MDRFSLLLTAPQLGRFPTVRHDVCFDCARGEKIYTAIGKCDF